MSFQTPQDMQNALQLLLTLVLKMGGDLATSRKDLEKPLLVLTVNNSFI